MATNWLLELGIPFDPLPSQGEISRILDEREREFSLKANKGQRGSYYSVMLERLGSIREDLADAEKLAAFADEAKRVSYPVIDRLIEQTLSGPEASKDAAKIAEATEFAQDLIADRVGMTHVMLPEGLFQKRMRAHAAANSDGAEASSQAAELYQAFVAKKPTGQHKYRSYQADLEIFGVDNLYDYVLGVGAAWDEMRQASLEDLLSRAESKVGDYQKGTSERSAAERLRSRAREVCVSAEEWSRYCDYLVWRDTKDSLDLMGRLAKLGSGQVAPDSYQRVVDKITALQGDASTAQIIVRGYCEAQDPPLALPKQQEKKRAKSKQKSVDMPVIQADSSGINLVTCPHCGKRTSNGAFCAECGGSLSTSLSSMHAAARMAQAGMTQQGSGAAQVQPQNAPQQAAYQVAQQQMAQQQFAQQQAVQQQVGAQYQAAQAGYTQPPAAPQKSSKAPIIVVGILVVIALGLVLFLVLGGPQAISADNSKSSGAETVQVDTAATTACTGSTRIMPQLPDGSAVERYRVALSQHAESDASGTYSDQLMELNVEGSGGFSMQDFTKYGAQLSDQTYQLTITDSDTSREYKLYVDFAGVTSNAPKVIEFICA